MKNTDEILKEIRIRVAEYFKEASVFYEANNMEKFMQIHFQISALKELHDWIINKTV